MQNEKKAGNSLPNLQKTASSSELQNYFTAIISLKKSGKEFPINLDEVWRLIYSQRSKAIQTLKKDFIEDEDFLLSQKVEQKNGSGGHNKVDVFLSTQCLEYFIAKKKREVFEVYRTVFHQAVENKQKAVSQEANYVEGQIFVTKLAKQSIKGVYMHNELWYEMNAVTKYLYNNYTSTSTFKSKTAPSNIIKLQVQNQKRLFINIEGINDVITNYYVNVPHHRIQMIFQDLFNVNKSELSNESSYEFFFTNSEMNDILFTIMSSPISKSKVCTMLQNGKGGQNV